MARTVQKIRLTLLSLGVSLLTAGPVDTGRSATAHRLLLFGGEEAIGTGYYTLGVPAQRLGVLFVPLHYDPVPESTSGPYLYGDIGYGAARYSGSGRDRWMKMYALKAGTGVRYSPGDDTDLRIGGAYQLARFAADQPIDGHGYDAEASLGYHPWIGEWNPSLDVSLRYTATAVTAAGRSDTTRSLIGKLRLGLITPVFAHPFGLPMKLELYGTALALHGDMATLMGTNTLWNAGIRTYLQSPVLQRWISDITLGAQIVRGKDLKGFSVGIGVKF